MDKSADVRARIARALIRMEGMKADLVRN